MTINKHPDPKVILSKNDFDWMQQMADATEEQVKSMALDYWHKHGVPSVNITVYLRRITVGQDVILSDYSLENAPLNVYIFDGPDSSTSAMAMSKEQKDIISKFFKDTANDIFLQTYGDRLSRIVELQRLDASMKREWRITRAFTLAGWLAAALLAAVILLWI